MNVNQLTITAEQPEALLTRAKDVMIEDDFLIVKGLIDTHLLLQQAVLDKTVAIKHQTLGTIDFRPQDGKVRPPSR